MRHIKPVVVVLVLVGIGGGVYYWRTLRPPETPPATVKSTAPPKPAIPSVRYPVPQPSAQVEKPLPPLDQSDSAILDALTGLFGRKSVEHLFITEDLVHRIVVAVDNLPRAKLPMRFQLFRPVSGRFLASGTDDNLAINPDNYRRYMPYVLLAESANSKTLVTTYIHYYPLFQKEYESLGYPHGYFNDRLVEAIDNLLATPKVVYPLKLIQPNVLYQFQDPAVEALSAGQKILLRMGPDNAARIKAKLAKIRSELTNQSP